MCAQMKLYKVEILVASCLRLINQLMFLHEEMVFYLLLAL